MVGVNEVLQEAEPQFEGGRAISQGAFEFQVERRLSRRSAWRCRESYCGAHEKSGSQDVHARGLSPALFLI
jgi:hypothetical protein